MFDFFDFEGIFASYLEICLIFLAGFKYPEMSGFPIRRFTLQLPRKSDVAEINQTYLDISGKILPKIHEIKHKSKFDTVLASALAIVKPGDVAVNHPHDRSSASPRTGCEQSGWMRF